MKLKFTLMAMAAVFAIGYQAEAIVVPSITNYARLNVALTIKTNISLPTVNLVERWTFKTAKITNKDLLALFEQSQFADTTFPDGAFLAVGWQGAYWGHVVVMDKNGVTVLFDATADYYDTGTEYFFLTFWNSTYGNNNNGYGAETGQSFEKNPGVYSFTGFNNAYFEFEDDFNNTFLYGDGASTEHLSERWDANDVSQGWSNSNVFMPEGGDNHEKLNGDTGSSVSGVITANGHGDGWSPIGPF